MTERIPQSTAKLIVFKAYLASDHTSEATGKTIAITISKNGGAFGNPNAGATNATEISSGWYKVTLDTTDTNTLGPLAIRGAVATIDDFGALLEVAKATNAGFTALPDAAAEAAGGLYTRGTGAGQINQDANGRVDANAKAWAGTATTLTSGLPDVNTKTITNGIIAAATFAANALDAVWSTAARVLTAGTNIVLAKGTGVTGFNDLDAAGIRTAVGLGSANMDTQLAAIAAFIDTEVAAIKAKTDLIPGTTDGKTFAQLVTLIAAVLLGKASGLNTTTAVYRAVDDSKDRVTATVDADGNRTAVTLDAA